MLTIRDILDFPEYAQAVLVAGHKGVNKQVEQMSVLETEALSGLKFEPNILFVSALSFIANDLEKQISLIQFLAEKKGSGLLIANIGYFMKEIAPELVYVADALGFPLISVPTNTTYPELITPVMSMLFNEENRSMSYALRLQKELCEMLLAEKDISSLIANAEKNLRKPILLLDYSNRTIYCNEASTASFDINEFLANEPQYLEGECLLPYREKHLLYYPIVMQKNYFGYLLVLDITVGKSEEIERINTTLNQLSIAITLLFAINKRQESKVEAQRANLIDDLINWDFQTEQSAILRCYALDINPLNKCVLMVVDLGVLSDHTVRREPSSTIYNTIRNLAQNHSRRHAVFTYRNSYIILFDSENKNHQAVEQSLALGKAITQYLRKTWPLAVRVGISGVFANCSAIPQAYLEAVKAVEIGRKLFKDEDCVSFNQLGVYSLLYDFMVDQQASTMLDMAIDKLLDYDQESHTQLFETFKALIERNGEINAVAKQMYVHKNTIVYRRQRIVEILGYNPFEQPYRLNFEIIFTIRQLKEH